MTLVSILIVNWNGMEFLDGCFQSIREKVRVPYEVIVMDNASTDGSADEIAQRYPWVRLIRSGENLGFAAGNNLAARHACGKYLLLLNNDTILQTNLSDGIGLLEDDSRIGAVGAAMFGGDGALRYSCAHFPMPARLWFFASMFYNPVKKGRLHDSSSPVAAYKVDYVEGSFLLTRADAWHKLSGIDERNYMYGDDVEYCRSLLNLGLLTVHCPSIRYTHFGGYNHSRMGYLFGGVRRFHRKFSSRRVQLEADFVLRAGLLLRIPWYWARAKVKKDEVSKTALTYAVELSRNWEQTLVDRHRFPLRAERQS